MINDQSLPISEEETMHSREEHKKLKDKLQSDLGFDFEEETKESSTSTEKGMTIHQRLAARISKKDESYGRDALLQAVLNAENNRDSRPVGEGQVAGVIKRDRLQTIAELLDESKMNIESTYRG